jgi:hypothetical protein
MKFKRNKRRKDRNNKKKGFKDYVSKNNKGFLDKSKRRKNNKWSKESD